MNTVTVAAEKAPQSFAPSEAVSLLVGSTVGEVECALVVQTLACCDGNRTRAARMLGLSVRTLRNKLDSILPRASRCPLTQKFRRLRLDWKRRSQIKGS